MRVSLVIFPVLNFLFELVGAEEVVEQLAQIPGHLVAIGPLVVLGVPSWRFLLFGSGSFFLRGWLLALSTFSLGFLLLLLLLLGFREGLQRCLELRVCSHAAQVNASSNGSDVANNAKEFVHDTGLHAVFLTLKLIAVHEALEQNETLASAILGNLLLDKLHHESRVVVDSRVLTLLVWIDVLCSGAELDILDTLRVDKGPAKFCLSQDFLPDQLVN